MDKRIIPTKNYFIFAGVAILSFVIVFNLAKIYKDYQNEKKVSNISSTISEVLESELDDYFTENDSKFIYLASSKEHDILEFEEDFKEYLIKNQISDEFIYIDLSKISDEFYQNFKNKYLIGNITNVSFEYANLVYISDKVVYKVLYTQEKEINIDEVKMFVTTEE